MAYEADKNGRENYPDTYVCADAKHDIIIVYNLISNISPGSGNYCLYA